MEKKPLIIDSHTHVYPPSDQFGEWDFKTIDEWQNWTKFNIYSTYDYIARLGRIPAIVKRSDGKEDCGGAGWRCLWDEKEWARKGGRHMWEGINESIKLVVREGKFFWTHEGIEYFMGLRGYPGPIEHMIQCMDAAGVDKAIFQTSKNLSKYACRMRDRYPDRLIPLCGVNEEMAYEEEEIEKLRMFSRGLGFKGLYYASPYAPWPSWDGWDHVRYDPFWKEIEQLGMVIYFNAQFGNEDYDITIPKLATVLKKFPNLKMVFLHGFPDRYFTGQVERKVFDVALHLVKEHQIILELLPLIHGPARRPDFPELFQKMLERLGSDKFVWGSELTGQQPKVDQYCNQRFSIEKTCPFLARKDLDLIMGGNLQQMFQLT